MNAMKPGIERWTGTVNAWEASSDGKSFAECGKCGNGTGKRGGNRKERIKMLIFAVFLSRTLQTINTFKITIMEDKLNKGKPAPADHEDYGHMLDRIADEVREELSEKLGFDIPGKEELQEKPGGKESADGLPPEVPLLPVKPQEGARVAAGIPDKAEDDESAGSPSIPFYRKETVRLFSVAAAAILLCVVCFHYFRTWEDGVRRQASAGMVALCGRDSTFRLSDGSEITLQGSTELSVDRQFGRKDRAVAMAGMGYMHVATDSMRPYTVNMPHGLALTVRGTSFNINAYPGNSRAEITVVSGCVAVRNTKTGESYGDFHKGERFVYDTATGKAFRQEGVNLAEATAWMEGGRVVLRHATVGEFKETVFRRYGKEVEIEDGAIPADADIMWESGGRRPDIEEVIEGVSFLYGSTGEVSGDKVIIRPGE